MPPNSNVCPSTYGVGSTIHEHWTAIQSLERSGSIVHKTSLWVKQQFITFIILLIKRFSWISTKSNQVFSNMRLDRIKRFSFGLKRILHYIKLHNTSVYFAQFQSPYPPLHVYLQKSSPCNIDLYISLSRCNSILQT